MKLVVGICNHVDECVISTDKIMVNNVSGNYVIYICNLAVDLMYR